MRTFAEQQLQYAVEASFADLDPTFTAALPIVEGSVRLERNVVRTATDRSAQAYLFQARPGYRMPQGLSRLSFDMYGAGAGTDTATGALVATPQHTLLANGLGGGDLTQVGGVAGASASATSVPNRTGTGLRGGIARYGEAFDGRCEGQPAVSGNPVTALLTGLPDAPGATDVIRAGLMAYVTRALGSSMKFLLRFTDDDDMQYSVYGCHLETLSMRFVTGEPILFTYNYLCAWTQEESACAIKTLAACPASMHSGGSYFLQDRGTATRATEPATEIEVTLNMGLIAQTGMVAGNHEQTVTGFVRSKPTNDSPAGAVRLVYPHGTAKRTEWVADGADTVRKHLLIAGSVGEGTADTEGRHLAVYMPDLFPIEQKPAFTDWNNLQYQTAMYGFVDGPDETNNLTRSPFRIAQF